MDGVATQNESEELNRCLACRRSFFYHFRPAPSPSVRSLRDLHVGGAVRALVASCKALAHDQLARKSLQITAQPRSLHRWSRRTAGYIVSYSFV